MTGVMEIASLPCHSGQGARMTLSMLIQVLGSIDCHCASVTRRGGRSFRSGQFRQARGIQFKAFNIQQPTAGMRQFRLG
ncbi:Hypothetical protein FORC30_2345 [Salmonella enterica]|nr:Hypothetical protein FORC30_2345 [Salmonella enterica]